MNSTQKSKGAGASHFNPFTTGWAVPIRLALGLICGELGYLLIVESQRLLGILTSMGGFEFFMFDVTQALILAIPIGLVLACFPVKSSPWARIGMHAIAFAMVGAYLGYAYWINRGHYFESEYVSFLTAFLIAPVSVFLYFFGLNRFDHAFAGMRSRYES